MSDPDFYLYRARVVRWIDGDTVELDLDLGLRITKRMRIRLVGPAGKYFDAWEKRGPEREAGILAWDFSRTFAPEGHDIHVRTFKDRKGKYGRWLAQILHAKTGDDLATHMVAGGHGEWGS